MKMHDLNQDQQDVILLIHPMLSSASGMKKYIADCMGSQYRYILPDLSGHGEDNQETYRSVQNEAEAIHEWLKANHIDHLKLGYGASLGGIVLLQLMQFDDLEFDHLFFEGTSFYTNAKALNAILRSVFLKKHKKAVSNPEFSRKKMAARFGEKAAPDLVRQFIALNDDSIINIVHDCTFVQLPSLSEGKQKNCIFAYGSEDFDYKKAQKKIPKIYPNAAVKVWDGYGHCARLSEDPNGYSNMLKKVIEGKDE